ncbi:DNA-directed RNA polymerase, mitochondrial-like [Mizuhopecten yessoensis]|uniref:DNA-directed RNA polymerase n=1 Tax=Mizuhopecten yessoensis TaxID=6573 RepID=A0A210QYP6_MIZYE|nr:DNA-directed RNA polymerase, mitochondrial-like [Mizuhopecten yessoensis]OWF53869.1 DNA-directed RNA polymerase, mitochondrial [Mizuhopecten yessoensis]
MSHLLRVSCSFRTSLTILKRFPEYRTCQHLQLQERSCANTRLRVVSKAVDQLKKEARIGKRKKKFLTTKAKLTQNIKPVNTTPHEFSRHRDQQSRIGKTFGRKSGAEATLLKTLENSTISVLSRDDDLETSNNSNSTWRKEHERLSTRINKFAPGIVSRKRVHGVNDESFKKETGQKSLDHLITKLEDLDIANILHTLTLKGKTQEAVDILFNYIYICNKLEDAQKPQQLYDVNLFNCIHRALAKEGNLMWMEAVLSWMKDQTVTPTLQTYAHFLECLGRYSDHPGRHSKIEYIVDQLQREGLEVEDLYRNCTYISDEWTCVRKAVETVKTNFEPRPCPEKRPYNNPLLTHLDTPEAKQAKIFNPNYKVMNKKKLMKKMRKRFLLEKDEFVALTPVVKLKGETTSKQAQFSTLKEHWTKCLTLLYRQSFMNNEEKQTFKERQRSSRISGYLEAVTEQEFADMIVEIVELLLRDSLHTCQWTPRQLARTIGKRLMQKTQYFYREKYGIVEKVGVVYKEYANTLLSESHMDGNHREIWEAICNKHMEGPTLGVQHRLWSKETQLWVGYRVQELIMKVLTVHVSKKEDNKTVSKEEPAFFETTNRNVFGKNLTFLMPHTNLLRLYRSRTRSVGFEMSELPSPIPPVPWTSINHGINLVGDAVFIRTSPSFDGDKQMKVIQAMPSADILSIFDVLNYMGSCPWIVNQSVLDSQIQVFSKNGSKELNIPMPGPSLPPHLKNLRRATNEKQFKQLWRERYKWKKKSLEMNSLWCSCLWTLTIANEFRDQVFWLPLNLDFRGRVYTCSSIMQFQSNDMTRSLFLFANGKPLGEKGLDWLKIHVINLTGLKKKHSNRDRIAYANQIIEEILDSADNPLNGGMWWRKSDEPWQTLACCKEIAAAVRSEDHTKFVSHFPVHQDGSCNGLQHYAALGRDKFGARSVNLDHSDVPKDVYSDVMEMVESQRQEDEKNGSEIAKFMAPYITRKVVKRPIMTSVYGVTPYGARTQVKQTLKEIPGFPEEQLKEASTYIATITLSNLQKRFQSARAIQEWFNLVSWTTSAGLKKHVEWKTPLGLHVVQTYTKQILKKNPKTKLTRRIKMPDNRKQSNSFPPNYIHCLDSVHMILTALHCMKENLTFSSVHDCFWTHACDVDVMNKICREQFVALHSQPLLQQLSEYMLEAHEEELKIREGMSDEKKQELKQYAEVLKPTEIKQGDFDLAQVLESEYFFS